MILSKAIALWLSIGAVLCLSACNFFVESVPSAPPLEGAHIGGEFTLIDHRGEQRTEQDFLGSYLIVYFGYSYCPDVCPIDLLKLTEGLAQFEQEHPERGAQVQPLFITVDPERDTPQALAPFVERYHPRLVGLSGSAEQIAQAAKAYLVSYQKQPTDNPDYYLVAHSQYAYLMSPEGKPLALLPIDDPTTPADEGTPTMVAADLERWVR